MTGSERETSTEKDLSGPARLALKLGSSVHAGVYRATGGKLFGRMGESPILLLNTVGRKSGRKRTSPLLYVMDGPDATVEVGDREVLVRAEEADSEEKVRLWQKMVEMYPSYDNYQTKTKREIPLLVLHPVEGGGAS